ncbi:6f878186-cc7d-4dcd-94b6-b3f306503f3c [Sclerotinia trifoliorum]|uniref:6f878186-cc7d-4dcd-94b6-b3f306503f3c n=1 Tax=Sclerotinia trifoliorum TaxID=28548 RepID=A0A8H2VMT4_9HELO|nr:6f878186-cc7d-4dcd-94b6-b3f306503f3c [Sclerotinia trifoliorum]
MNNVNMSGMPNMGGPVGGGMPMMNNGVAGGAARHPTNNDNNRSQLNTYIYEYFLKNGMFDCARTLLNHEQINVVKDSPGRGDGEDGDDSKDDIDSKRPNDLPLPNLPKECPEGCFLYEWFCLFWDMFNAQRGKGDARNVLSYVSHTQQSRQKAEQQQATLRGLNPLHGGPAYGRMPGGMMGPNDLARKAMMNGRGGGPNQQHLQQLQQMQMQKQQVMQREPSDGNHPQRAQSPSSAENAPSPSKRPRLDGPTFNQQGGMAPNGRGQTTGIPAQQFSGFQGQNPNQKNLQAAYQANLSQQQQKQMSGVAAGGPPNQGSPMMTQGADSNAMAAYGYGAGEMNQNGVRGAPGGPQGGQGNHALQDYQMQLMLLEQQNKKRLMMARQEQDAIRPDGQGGPGGPGMGPNGPNFQQGTSPQSGPRSVNSPNPSEQMKRGTPHMNNPGIPSPLPEGQNRGSPSTMNFNMGQGGQMDGGMNPQFYKIDGMNGNMMQNGMRPPSSHPGFNPQGMSQQQIMMARQQAGNWQNGPNGGAPMVANPSQGPPQAMGTPQQRNMPPPAAPANAGVNGRTQPSSPQGSTAAPPTPQQSNKANPKKKNEAKETKTKRATKKGSAANLNAGATPSADQTQEAATPTPATPITPVHTKSFNNGPNPNGAVQPVNGQPMAAAPNAGVSSSQPDPLNSFPMNDQPFDMLEFQNPMGGNSDVLTDFDFDSFLNDSTGGADDTYNFDPSFLGDNEISETV